MTDSKIYLDTVPFIYCLEKNTQYFETVREFFMKCNSRAVQLISSFVTVEEYCVYPLSRNDERAVAAFDTFISGMEISIIPADKQIALEAAKLRAQYKGFRALDAIHLATAKLSGCTSFVTNDKRLGQMREMRVITMDDLKKYNPHSSTTTQRPTRRNL